MNQNRPTKTHQKGLTLLEALVSIGLLMAALALVGALARSGQQQNSINQALNLLASIDATVRTHYGVRESYAGLNTSTAVQLGAIPAAMARETLPGNWAAAHAWGGALFVGANSWDGVAVVADSGFFVQFNGLPREACISLILQAGSTYRGVAVGQGTGSGPTLSGITRHVTAEGTQLNIATVTGWCTSAQANTVRFETL
jgi:type II secretory pathway pseudopilin PulG